jgi:aryl carrier-like protein
VFHAAGIVQNVLLAKQTPEQMREILAAKMVGGWLLHRLLADAPLDLFVLFSSSSALLSSPMLASYSAANAFLDALAHHRRSLGKPALSVNWGPWAAAGMAARLLAGEESKANPLKEIANGVGVLSTERALGALEQLLEDGAVQTGVMPMDWDRWRQWSYGDLSVPRYLSLLISASDRGVTPKTREGINREHLLGAELEVRKEMVISYLAQQMARILKVALASVDRETPMSHMGFDSLMSIELKNRIESDLGVSVAMARLIQGPTLLELTAWVNDVLVAEQSLNATALAESLVGEFEEGVL